MKWFKNVDRELGKRGFVKLRESAYGVCYRKFIRETKGYRRLEVLFTNSGVPIIKSYHEGMVPSGFHNEFGLTPEETKLILRKIKQMRRKYRWK